MYTYVDMCSLSLSLSLYIYIYIYTHVCMYVRMYVYIYMDIIYICVYIYTHTYTYMEIERSALYRSGSSAASCDLAGIPFAYFSNGTRACHACCFTIVDGRCMLDRSCVLFNGLSLLSFQKHFGLQVFQCAVGFSQALESTENRQVQKPQA